MLQTNARIVCGLNIFVAVHFKNTDVLCVPLESVGLNPTPQLRQISCSLLTSKDIMLSKTTEYNIYVHANQHYASLLLKCIQIEVLLLLVKCGRMTACKHFPGTS